ncbi:minor tail protein [Escherichia virus ECH1]
MAIDTFNSCTQIQGGSSSFSNTNNLRLVSFGNGFEQRGTGGYRTTLSAYSLTYTNKDWRDVDFCLNHIITPFFWTTPQGDTSMFVIQQDSISVTPLSEEVQTVNMQFVEVFSSMR